MRREAIVCEETCRQKKHQEKHSVLSLVNGPIRSECFRSVAVSHVEKARKLLRKVRLDDSKIPLD